MQVTHLLSVWLAGGEESKALQMKLDEKIDNFAAGELEHAAEAISSIWDLSRGNQSFPSIPRVHWGSFISTPQERSMRTSLINSVQGGSLFHRKYWARKSRGGSICPVYFPSVMPGETLSQVSSCE